jgi:hypothetical protein
MTLEKIAADIHALVTRDAAERFKKLIAGEFLGTDGARFADEPTIETAARGKERSLVGCDRIQKGGHIRRASVRNTESLRHHLVGTDFNKGLLRA